MELYVLKASVSGIDYPAYITAIGTLISVVTAIWITRWESSKAASRLRKQEAEKLQRIIHLVKACSLLFRSAQGALASEDEFDKYKKDSSITRHQVARNWVTKIEISDTPSDAIANLCFDLIDYIDKTIIIRQEMDTHNSFDSIASKRKEWLTTTDESLRKCKHIIDILEKDKEKLIGNPDKINGKRFFFWRRK
ncbi:hypothetical protein ED236_03760 [Pseudomethylobacillus aquaticus]|uniref:Uncharacterized protein n=1 Tax=Pseudomethylobacillus aquaticus TaxID=2676064 RepID=A0A3N0V2K1_9PROT|nr:hypothetical protein [Pseudomethylobacillus aquaticus]ROH86832.1 hypothetical protein ED236_03760 [Pseudomethylobacillus aquaticus]